MVVFMSCRYSRWYKPTLPSCRLCFGKAEKVPRDRGTGMLFCVCIGALDDEPAYIYACGTFQFVGLWSTCTHSSRFLVLQVKMCWMRSHSTPFRHRLIRAAPTVSGYNMSPRKWRESISCLQPGREERAQIQINVQAMTGCICFRLVAISASCAHTIPRRQTSGWNGEKAQSTYLITGFCLWLWLCTILQMDSLFTFLTIFH